MKFLNYNLSRADICLRKCDNDKKTNLTSQLNLSTGTNLGDLFPSLDKVHAQLKMTKHFFGEKCCNLCIIFWWKWRNLSVFFGEKCRELRIIFWEESMLSKICIWENVYLFDVICSPLDAPLKAINCTSMNLLLMPYALLVECCRTLKLNITAINLTWILIWKYHV